MPKILLFPASQRRESYQRRLLEYVATLLAGHCDIDVLNSTEVTLPLFNQDLESDPGVMAEVHSLHQRFGSADGIIVASPEYNGHVSPYLKNTVDWVSRLGHIDTRYARSNPFRDKPLLLCSATTGWSGGVIGLRDARSIFSYLGCLVAAEEIAVSRAADAILADGYRFSPHYAEYMKEAVENFLSLVRRHYNVQPGCPTCAAVGTGEE